MLLSPLIPRQFFPPSDRPELLVDLRLPQNASIFATDDMSERLSKVLATDPDVASWSSYVGRGAIRFYLPLAVELPNDFFTQAVVVAKDVAARKRLQVHLEEVLANQFPAAISRVSPLGPRAAGGVAGAVSRQRAGCLAGAGHRVAARGGSSPAIRTRRM